jgi:hypothetical protein
MECIVSRVRFPRLRSRPSFVNTFRMSAASWGRYGVTSYKSSNCFGQALVCIYQRDCTRWESFSFVASMCHHGASESKPEIMVGSIFGNIWLYSESTHPSTFLICHFLMNYSPTVLCPTQPKPTSIPSSYSQ